MFIHLHLATTARVGTSRAHQAARLRPGALPPGRGHAYGVSVHGQKEIEYGLLNFGARVYESYLEALKQTGQLMEYINQIIA